MAAYWAGGWVGFCSFFFLFSLSFPFALSILLFFNCVFTYSTVPRVLGRGTGFECGDLAVSVSGRKVSEHGRRDAGTESSCR